MKHAMRFNMFVLISLYFRSFNESVVWGKGLCYHSDSILSCTFAVLLTVLIVFPALEGLVTPLFLCIINHLHFRSFPPRPCSQPGWQSILMFATVHRLPNGLTAWWRQQHSWTSPSGSSASGQSSAGLILEGTARHFSALKAANI